MKKADALAGAERVQLNCRLPETLHREFKAKCALEGWTVAAAVEHFAGECVAGRLKLPKHRRS